MDDEELDEEFPTFPWSWKTAGVHVGFFVKNLLDSASGLVGGLSEMLAASSNYQIEQREFRNQAALEIESITEHTEE